MAFVQQSSPHAHKARPTSRVMLWVLIAALPGLLAQTLFFGWGNLINVVFCIALAIASEAALLKLRKKPVAFFIKDNTAAVTGLLLALSLPQFAPWWVSAVAVISAIVVAKQLYGGLGSNPFNPAMVGYALVLVSFPVAMTTNWAEPAMLWDGAPGFGETLATIASGQQTAVDGWTMATPLDEYKHKITTHTATEVLNHPTFGEGIARGWEWVNAAFLAGGLLLIALRIITWHIPTGFLGGLWQQCRPLCTTIPASACRRDHARCLFYRYRPGVSSYEPPGETHLWSGNWHSDLPDPHLGQLSRRRGVQRSADEFCRSFH